MVLSVSCCDDSIQSRMGAGLPLTASDRKFFCCWFYLVPLPKTKWVTSLIITNGTTEVVERSQVGTQVTKSSECWTDESNYQTFGGIHDQWLKDKSVICLRINYVTVRQRSRWRKCIHFLTKPKNITWCHHEQEKKLSESAKKDAKIFQNAPTQQQGLHR